MLNTEQFSVTLRRACSPSAAAAAAARAPAPAAPRRLHLRAPAPPQLASSQRTATRLIAVKGSRKQQHPSQQPRRFLSHSDPLSNPKMVSLYGMFGWGIGLTIGAAICALYWLQDHLLYFPQIFNSRIQFDDPARFNLTHEEIFLRTPDNVRIQVGRSACKCPFTYRRSAGGLNLL